MACFVLGCYEDPIVGAIHRRFGPVDCCHGHDPNRHGYALPFGAGRERQNEPAAKPAPPATSGGARTARKVPAPPRPIAPAAFADPF